MQTYQPSAAVPAIPNAILGGNAAIGTARWAASRPIGRRASPLAAYLSLPKPRVVALILFTSAVASIAAARGMPPAGTLLLLLLSGALAAGGAATLNQFFDRHADRLMARTRRRPLVTGLVPHPSLVLLAGVVAVVSGVALAAIASPLLALFEGVGAFVYVVVYPLWLKRRTVLNIVIGGLAGSAAVLGGWVVVDPGLGLTPWLMATLVFVWTPAHFWSLAVARRADYEQAALPMLPVIVGPRRAAWWILVHIVATVAFSAWVGLAAGLGSLYFGPALLAAAVFLGAGVHLWRRPEPAAGWQLFKLSGVYLAIIFVGILVDTLAHPI